MTTDLLLNIVIDSCLVRNNFYAPRLIGGGIKRCFCLTSDVCLTSVWRLSVAYIGPNSRTERPRKTKIGTEVAHVTMIRAPFSRSIGQRSRSQDCGGLSHNLLHRTAYELLHQEFLHFECSRVKSTYTVIVFQRLVWNVLQQSVKTGVNRQSTTPGLCTFVSSSALPHDVCHTLTNISGVW